MEEVQIVNLLKQDGLKQDARKWAKELGVSYYKIRYLKKKHSLVFGKPKVSEKTRKKQSLARKQFLKDNPDKHGWRNKNKFKSEPCEKAKSFLKENNIQFIEEFQPEIEGRFFSIDIACPDKMIAIEINGNQHYEKNGSLKPYYQERHDLIASSGWTVFEVHYSACFDKSQWDLFSNLISSTTPVSKFDYFNYKPREKKLTKDLCKCGKTKTFAAEKCITCTHLERTSKRLKRLKEIKQRPKPDAKAECLSCGEREQKNKKARLCFKCYKAKTAEPLPKGRFFDWPSVETVEALVWSAPMSKLSKKLGVSDVSIKKFCKRSGVQTPRVGYWLEK